MGATFISLDAKKLENFFAKHGFVRGVQGNEVIFTRLHDKNKNLQVKVYSSLTDGLNKVRGCGKDAIRVCAVFDDGNKSFGIKGSTRVFRVGEESRLYDRLHKRMQEAYGQCNSWLKTNSRCNSSFVGEIGHIVKLKDVVLIRRHGPYQGKSFLVFKDSKGNQLTYWTKEDQFQVNESYDLHGVVKNHKKFQGVCQTELSNLDSERILK